MCFHLLLLLIFIFQLDSVGIYLCNSSLRENNNLKIINNENKHIESSKARLRQKKMLPRT